MNSRILALGAALALAACSGEPAAPEAMATSFSATALSLKAVRVRWTLVEAAGYYKLYRRENLSGPFTVLRDNVNRAQVEYLDSDVKADTRYGYQLEVIDRQGASLGFTTVAGTQTPPLPGIAITTVTEGPPAALDPDGYTALVRGSSDTLSVQIDAVGQRTISPLKSGPYSVLLEGLADNCESADSLVRNVTVTDQGLATVQAISFRVACADPSLGNLSIAITTTGDLPPSRYGIKVVGITDSLQAVVIERTTASANTTEVFPALKPGDYQVSLQDVPANCTVAQGATLDNVPVTPGTTTSRAFTVTCTDPDAGNKPFILSSTFLQTSGQPGSVVELDLKLDLTAQADKRATTTQATIKFDPAILVYDSGYGGQLNTVFVIGTSVPGQVTPGGVKAGLGVPGLVTVARLFFTVAPGATTGATMTTSTTGIAVTVNTTAQPSPSVNVSDQVRKQEATFTVGTGGGGGGGNQSPTSRPGGPYTGAVGTAVAFDGSASSDPDGTISTYEWNFGDGGTATGATPTHTYTSAAGSPFTVSLTVTDNQGGTGTATTTATITGGGGGGGNQLPIAVPGGPYTGAVGAPVLFNGSGSSDPDGTIVSYAWSFGDGASGTGATVSHTYAAAGSYVAALTVTDNAGGQNTATTGVTISGGGGGGQPFTWLSSFGPVQAGQVVLTITLDLSADISQTPGPEALAAWAVLNLRWDPAVLQFFALNIDSGTPGGFNFTNAPQGSISFSGSASDQNSQGVVPIARVRFNVVGAPGTSTTTQSTLGALLGTPATGNFSYGSFTQVIEGTFTAP